MLFWSAIILCNFEQFWNARLPILVTLAGIVIDVKLVALENAPELILIRVDVPAKVIDVKLVKFANVPEPILVTLSGMVIDVKLVAL